ncbi:hypothetical protein ACH47X_12860 [Promicromonospora kroppenstedtii]|uniref:Uncharacterized protein n=1 Tax=Promicromonospora kroppenstedtii TaxID=440482 RepID=A0ABW7XKF4_9MICO
MRTIRRSSTRPTTPASGRSAAPLRPATSPRYTVPLATAPLLAAVLALTGCTGSPPGSGATEAAQGQGTAAASPRPSGTGSDAPDEDRSAPSAPPTADAEVDPQEDGRTAPMPSGGSAGQSGGDGSELAPPDDAGEAGASPGERVAELPAAGRMSRSQRSADGPGLVAQFPADVVRVPDDATVDTSSVTGQDGRFQVALDVTTKDGCTEVLLGYRSWFTTGGFAETGTTAGPDRTTVTLERDDGTVVLVTSPKRKGCDVELLATLSAG